MMGCYVKLSEFSNELFAKIIFTQCFINVLIRNVNYILNGVQLKFFEKERKKFYTLVFMKVVPYKSCALIA